LLVGRPNSSLQAVSIQIFLESFASNSFILSWTVSPSLRLWRRVRVEGRGGINPNLLLHEEF
jgi:hypothetical protein